MMNILLDKRIKEILDKTKQLRLKKFSEYRSELDYVCIFTNDEKEFNEFNQELSKIAQVYSEDSEGIVYFLNEEIDNEEGKLSTIKLNKPSDEKFPGYADYIVENYENLKASGIGKVIQTDDNFEIIAIYGDNVNIFIPEEPLSLEIKENFNMKKQNQHQEDSTNQEDQVPTNNFEEQLNEEREKRLRIMADFENYKRRIEQEKATFGAIANMGIIQSILEISDDLELALQDENLDLEAAKSAIKNAQNKIATTTMNAGVEKIEVKPGDEFDKEKMEAIQAITNEQMKNKVIAVISSAYKYVGKDGVLKSAKVIVGK